MAIDPISAPKALDDAELELFHSLGMELRAVDLRFMRSILDLIHEGVSEGEALRFTDKEIERLSGWYQNNFGKKVLDAYRRTGLEYIAEENPFIC